MSIRSQIAMNAQFESSICNFRDQEGGSVNDDITLAESAPHFETTTYTFGDQKRGELMDDDGKLAESTQDMNASEITSLNQDILIAMERMSETNTNCSNDMDNDEEEEEEEEYNHKGAIDACSAISSSIFIFDSS